MVRVQGSGFRVQGLGFRVLGLGFRVWVIRGVIRGVFFLIITPCQPRLFDGRNDEHSDHETVAKEVKKNMESAMRRAKPC